MAIIKNVLFSYFQQIYDKRKSSYATLLRSQNIVQRVFAHNHRCQAAARLRRSHGEEGLVPGQPLSALIRAPHAGMTLPAARTC